MNGVPEPFSSKQSFRSDDLKKGITPLLKHSCVCLPSPFALVGSARKRAFRSSSLLGGFLREGQAIIVRRHQNRLALVERPFEDFFRQRIFQRTLNGPPHWPRAVLRVITFAHQEVLRLFIELQDDVPGL